MSLPNTPYTIVNKYDEDGERIPFRLQAKCIFMTWKTHLDKEKLLMFLSDFQGGVEHFIISNETSDKIDAYEHTHACISFVKKGDIKNHTYFDYEGIHCSFGKVKKWAAAVQYLRKDDQNPLTNIELEKKIAGLIDKIKDAETDIDAFKQCDRMSDICGAKIIRDLKNKAPSLLTPGFLEDCKNLVLKDWHKFIIDRLFNTANPRILLWIYDKIGANGKTDLLRYLIANFSDQIPFLKCTGGAEAKHIIKKWIEYYGDPTSFVFDLPRTMSDRDSLYTLAETISDGLMTSTRYDGQNIGFKKCPVFVFANFLPNTEAMSEDRWLIYNLDKGVLTDITDVTIANNKNTESFF